MTAPDLQSLWGVSPLRQLHGGHRAQVWLCADATGAHLVAKSTTRDAAALLWLIAVQAAARAEGFIVPQPVLAPDGCPVVGGWTLEPFIEGRAAVAANLPALAPRLAAFHRRARDTAQRPGFLSSRALIVQDRGGDVDMNALPAALAAACRAAWARLTGSEVAIHGDLGPGNVILTADGPALIDWDEARVDLPAYDMPLTGPQKRAILAWEIASCWQTEPGRAKVLAAALL